ncbi:hypothetical protein ACFW9L_11640 [Streptomyces sp. NPDC059517]|uniref:hypothetical protein n=1 Tax=Streptomyces sp. NPDC059517 TaxID=3346855 RepID=UPI00369648AF
MSEPTLHAQVGGAYTASHGGPSGHAREHTPTVVKIKTHRAGERTTVVAAGEIDRDACPALRHEAQHPGGEFVVR